MPTDAVVAAQSAWRAGALPDRPDAWLYRAALRKGLDRLRRAATETGKASEAGMHLDPEPSDDSQLPDARLGFFFACAHPALAPEAQIALILFHMAGLSAADIARAFLAREASVYQRLKRARDKLRANAMGFDVPGTGTWPERLPPVLSAIEIIYDQGHANLAGGIGPGALSRDGLQLAETLARLLPDECEVLALAAMLSFCEARRPARLDTAGRFIALKDQDPARWDSACLARAARLMDAAGDAVASSVLPPGPYAIRARIEACHCLAIASGQSRAGELVALYDDLMALAPSPVVAINRALALAKADGVAAGLAALAEATEGHDLTGHAPWHLARAELLTRAGEPNGAALHLKAARQLLPGPAERAFVSEKLALLTPT